MRQDGNQKKSGMYTPVHEYFELISNVALSSDVGNYQRHRPEKTLLYRIVEEYYPAFAMYVSTQDRELPGYAHREFNSCLRCGRLEMASFEYVATGATLSIWSHSDANAAAFA